MDSNIVNQDNCRYCDTHRYSFGIDGFDEVCVESPSGYHRVDSVKTWRDRTIDLPGAVAEGTLDEWADKAFSRPGEGDKTYLRVPVGMRRALVRLWLVYPNMPRGLADPMYVANVIAHEVGFGDGHGNFTSQLGGE